MTTHTPGQQSPAVLRQGLEGESEACTGIPERSGIDMPPQAAERDGTSRNTPADDAGRVNGAGLVAEADAALTALLGRSPTGRWAMEFVHRGFKLIPIQRVPGDTKASKKPLPGWSGWQKDNVITTLPQAVEHFASDKNNIAVRLDDFVDLDFDQHAMAKMASSTPLNLAYAFGRP